MTSFESLERRTSGAKTRATAETELASPRTRRGELSSEVERELVKKCRAGDARFFEPLVRAYEAPGMRVAMGMMRDSDAAHDALQEAFVKAWKNLGSFDLKRAFGPWFFQILRNQCRDMLRSRQARAKHVGHDERLEQRPAGSEYTVRIAVISMLVLAGCLFAMSLTTGNINASLNLLGFMSCMGWLLLAVVVCVQGTGVVAGERARGALDVLLATPIPGPWLLWQFEQTMRRWRRGFAAVLLTLAGGRGVVTLLRSLGDGAQAVDGLVYLAVALGARAVYPRLVSAAAVWIGLRSSTHAKATVTTLALVAAWCLAWAVVPGFVHDLASRGGAAPPWLGYVSPLSVIARNESGAGFTGFELALIGAHFAAYVLAAFTLDA